MTLGEPWLSMMLDRVAVTKPQSPNKILQTCNGWLMEAKRADGSPAVVFVDPKAQTIVDADFR
ncbi:MAG: hypothetical protein WA709_37795 [Stellaceae bacterium]